MDQSYDKKSPRKETGLVDLQGTLKGGDDKASRATGILTAPREGNPV